MWNFYFLLASNPCVGITGSGLRVSTGSISVDSSEYCCALKKNIFTCMGVSSACLSVQHMHAECPRVRSRCESPGTRVTDDSELGIEPESSEGAVSTLNH